MVFADGTSFAPEDGSFTRFYRSYPPADADDQSARPLCFNAGCLYPVNYPLLGSCWLFHGNGIYLASGNFLDEYSSAAIRYFVASWHQPCRRLIP